MGAFVCDNFSLHACLVPCRPFATMPPPCRFFGGGAKANGEVIHAPSSAHLVIVVRRTLLCPLHLQPPSHYPSRSSSTSHFPHLPSFIATNIVSSLYGNRSLHAHPRQRRRHRQRRVLRASPTRTIDPTSTRTAALPLSIRTLDHFHKLFDDIVDNRIIQSGASYCRPPA